MLVAREDVQHHIDSFKYMSSNLFAVAEQAAEALALAGESLQK